MQGAPDLNRMGRAGDVGPGHWTGPSDAGRDRRRSIRNKRELLLTGSREKSVRRRRKGQDEGAAPKPSASFESRLGLTAGLLIPTTGLLGPAADLLGPTAISSSAHEEVGVVTEDVVIVGVGLDGPAVHLLGPIEIFPGIREEIGVVTENKGVIGIGLDSP